MKDEKKELNFGQKLATSTLAIFAVVVFFVLALNMRDFINKPFKYNVDTDAGICLGGTCPLEDSEDLLNKDTDKDGLSDWDELNLYRTSPYLEDSDSDGFLDREEVEQGHDPNCSEGNNCNTNNVLLRSEINENNANISTENLESLNLLSELDSLSVAEDQNSLKINENKADYSEEEFKFDLEGKSNVSELKELLLNAGMDKDLLDQIDDETLLKTYKEILQSQ